ncbi:MAG: type II secretion system minor pseudopilin GspK [Magnetococcales bacterium]|nr:type II secretion system minor pseudopilin GspK [Magnetococcales bacterium]
MAVMDGRHGSGESGVALITALLIVSLATIAMVAMATRQKMELRYASMLMGRDQGWNMVLGGEAWARAVLRRSEKENEWDSLDEPWAQKMAPMQVEGATVSGWNEDLQSRFNLNNLVVDGKRDNIAMAMFERLLERRDLDPLVAAAVADWMDADNETGGPRGAENDIYGRLKYPYSAANQPMQSASELMLVQGFNAKAWEKLKSFVVALPVRTPINVNTAPPEILSSLAANITMADADQVVRTRFMNPFKNVNDFRNHPNLVQAKVDLQKLTEFHIGVRSSFFMVNAQAEVGRGRMLLRSLLRRGPDGVVVLRRTMGWP